MAVRAMTQSTERPPCRPDTAGNGLWFGGAHLFVLAVSALEASACVTVSAHNESHIEVRADWVSLGCGGYDDTSSQILVCKTHSLPANDASRSYDFKWGTTGQTLVFTFDGIGDAKDLNISAFYTYRRHSDSFDRTHHILGNTPSSCGRHYSVRITSQDIQDESDRAYQIEVNESRRTGGDHVLR